MSRRNKQSKPSETYFRFVNVDVLGAISMCFIGTDMARHEKSFASFMLNFNGKREPEYYWRMLNDFKESAQKFHPSVDGATFYPDSDPDVPIVYLPKYEPRLLVHEVVHAVSRIMYVYGLEDGKHSEIRAYLTDFLFGKFSEGVKQ